MNHHDGLGGISTILADKNIPLTVFLVIEAVLVLTALITLARTVTDTHFGIGGGAEKRDTGKGFWAFVVLLALALACSFLDGRLKLPSTPAWTAAITMSVHALNLVYRKVVYLCAVGAVGCLLRKIISRNKY